MSDDVMSIEIPPSGLQGLLGVPAQARGIVLFAHGSGSGRLSPRNQRVAAALREAGIATLLLDLLTDDEETDRANVFDIELLARRLGEATDWVHLNADTALLPLGYFGASTGAGAALMAAAQPKHRPAAIVSRGGRPDLAGDVLEEVRAPTLLIVGSHDPQVLELNRRAMARMRCEKVLSIVPGASHLFEEPGTLDEVIRLAVAWFRQHLGTPPA
jgi:putative phosphoribosyl transferase